jgi:cytochrome c5
MQRNRLILPLISVLALVVTLGISSWNSPDTIIFLQQATPTGPVSMSPTEDSWIIVDLPEDATQLEYGAEVYRLVCKACHGDKGQGLTDDWRAQWAPQDQNCWQSKCHARNHPPDGFFMPQVPAVLGQPIRGFGNALNLYTYTHNYMPWHDRGSMTQKESWSVTAYLLKINGIDPPLELNAENAANIDLSVIDPNLYPTSVPPSPETKPFPAPENTPIPAPTQTHDIQPADTTGPLWIVVLVLAILIALTVIYVRRRSAA